MQRYTAARRVALVLLWFATAPATAGLVIVAPAADGADLVHGLAADDAARAAVAQTIAARGIYGVVTVVRPLSFARLAYADNLVNAASVDVDALGDRAASLTDDEILRVLAPGGTATVTRGGKAVRLVKPRPAGMDDWTHFDYDAAGTGVSHDKGVAPPTHLQWRSEAQEYIGLGGNPAGYRPYTGFRVANGRAFALYGTGEIGGRNKEAPAMLIARDAFNGTPIWRIPGYSSGGGTPQEYQFVAAGDRVYTYLAADGPLVALDAATGKVAVTYEKAGRLPGRGSNLAAGYVMFRCAAGLVVHTDQRRLTVLDAKTGEVRWSHEERDDFVCFPRVAERERRVFVQAVENAAAKIQGRWANLRTNALLCFDLDTGELLWRSEAMKGGNFGQSILAGDKVYLFNPAGIGAADSWGKKNPGGNVACLNAGDGKLLWSTPEKFVWGYNLLVRDGRPYFATPDTLNAVNPADGTVAPFWRAPFNNRCNRTSATDDWVIMGLGVFVDRDGVANVKGIARSGCAQGAFPANGLTYFTPNTCTCFTMLRGHLALSSQPTAPAVADELRLIRGGVAAAPAADAGGPTMPTRLDTPVSFEWAAQVNRGAPETPPVRSADGRLTFVAVTHEHRVECRAVGPAAGKVIWAFTAGGRVSQPPVLIGDALLFGGHDGYAYCLDAATGALRWRFLAAPAERFVVSHGQVESAWPVYNVVAFDGRACFTAGLHPELGGGIAAWGLDPATGKIAWHKTFKRSEVIARAGAKIAPNRVLNSPLTVDGDKLAITGLTFAPAEDDAAIQARIDTSSVGDKLRNAGWTVRGTPVEKR